MIKYKATGSPLSIIVIKRRHEECVTIIDERVSPFIKNKYAIIEGTPKSLESVLRDCKIFHINCEEIVSE